MNLAHDAIDAALNDATRLRKLIRRQSSAQVKSIDELALLKATSLAWFHEHRLAVMGVVIEGELQNIDNIFAQLLQMSDLRPSRQKCDALLKQLREQLSATRKVTAMAAPATRPAGTTEQPPNFSTLIADNKMQAILTQRWIECARCIEANAPLAATVMMGGLLEGLLLARVHREPDKTKIFVTHAAPKNSKTGAVIPLKEWSLKNYIDVAHELKWISKPARDLGAVLRDYRNYIHPEKQLSQDVSFTVDDVAMFWEIAKGVCRQLIRGSM